MTVPWKMEYERQACAEVVVRVHVLGLEALGQQLEAEAPETLQASLEE